MKVDTFRIDDGERGFVGVHNPRNRWNGWACPSFTLVAILEIAEWIDECVGDDPDAVRLFVDGVTVWEMTGDDRYELPSHTVNGVTHYSLRGWVWDADGDFPADELD